MRRAKVNILIPLQTLAFLQEISVIGLVYLAPLISLRYKLMMGMHLWQISMIVV